MRGPIYNPACIGLYCMFCYLLCGELITAIFIFDISIVTVLSKLPFCTPILTTILVLVWSPFCLDRHDQAILN